VAVVVEVVVMDAELSMKANGRAENAATDGADDRRMKMKSSRDNGRVLLLGARGDI